MENREVPHCDRFLGGIGTGTYSTDACKPLAEVCRRTGRGDELHAFYQC